MAPTRTPKQSPGTRRAGAPRSRPATASTPRRTPAFAGRRSKPAPQSNAKKVVGAVTTALPGLIQKAGQPAKKAKPKSRKGGAGLAMLAAGAGLAMKNRDKLPGKLGGGRSSEQDLHGQTEPISTTPAPVTPVTPVTNADGPGLG